MNSHVLIAVDAFGEANLETLTRPLNGWATWERISENASPDEFRTRLQAADIAIGWPEPEWLLSSPVKLLMCPSVGYEPYLDRGLEIKPDFIFCNAGSVYSEGIAEHCLAMMLALARRLPEYARAMQTRTWRQLPHHAELSGSTALIVGLGSMGTAIARRCAALGMTVIGVRRSATSPVEPVQHIYPPSQIQHVVAQADHVIAALPGGKATAGLFNQEVLRAMKCGAYFYNLGRGSTVDEQALIEHLTTGHLGGAGLDVFADEPLPETNPLWAMENVIITPHMAGLTADYADRLVAMMAENLRRHHLNESLLNVIDLRKGYS